MSERIIQQAIEEWATIAHTLSRRWVVTLERDQYATNGDTQ